MSSSIKKLSAELQKNDFNTIEFYQQAKRCAVKLFYYPNGIFKRL